MTVGVVAMSVRVENSSTLTVIVPAHSAGAVDVVVTNPSGSSATLTSGFTYASDQPFTLTPSINVVDAGGEISVSWTAPAARPRDWIAVFRVAGSYDDDWWGNTDGATTGTHTLTAPMRPGEYEFRYLVDGGFVEVARSSAVTVR